MMLNFYVDLQSPWQIGALKYLETEIGKWPSRPSGEKQGKWGQNGAKQGLIHAEIFD